MTRLLKLGAFVTAVFSLLTLFDQWHRLLELFSHFRLQYCVVAVTLAMGFVVLRDRNWALGMLAIAATNAWFVAPWYFGATPLSPDPSTSFTILHANVYAHNNEHQLFIELIRKEQPDVVFVQEIDEPLQTSLLVIHKDYPYREVVSRNDNFGIAVYSRLLLDSVVQHESPPFGYPSLIVTTHIDSQLLTLISTHPMPPIGRTEFDGRNQQLQDTGELVNAAPRPVVLIGDLNISMWAHHYGKLVEQTGLRNARAGFGILPSWPVHLPFAMIPIDQCLVSNNIGVVDIRTGPDIGSDHLPLIVTLTML